MMKLESRYYRLRIGKGGDARVFETKDGNSLRLRFNVTHYYGGNFSQAVIDLYNINTISEGLIIGNYTDITLEAGYENNYGVIFKGEVMSFNRLREGPNKYLRMYANSGVRVLDEKRMQPKGLNKNISPYEVAQMISATSGLPTRIDQNEFKDFQLKVTGYPMSGTVRQELDRLCLDYDLHWYIENGTLVIKKKHTKTPGTPIKISEESGLIGTPTITSSGVNFRTKLNASLKQNRLVNLVAKTPRIQFSGAFVVDQSRFTAKGTQRIGKINIVGDTHDNDWYTECDCFKYTE